MFRILYLFVFEGPPPTWTAYAHAGVIIGLMGLVYLQGTRRRIRFMPMMATMAGIFMIDVLAYVVWLVWLIWRGRRRRRPATGDRAHSGDGAIAP